jgi:hypothetical protein
MSTLSREPTPSVAAPRRDLALPVTGTPPSHQPDGEDDDDDYWRPDSGGGSPEAELDPTAAAEAAGEDAEAAAVEGPVAEPMTMDTPMPPVHYLASGTSTTGDRRLSAYPEVVEQCKLMFLRWARDKPADMGPGRWFKSTRKLSCINVCLAAISSKKPGPEDPGDVRL